MKQSFVETLALHHQLLSHLAFFVLLVNTTHIENIVAPTEEMKTFTNRLAKLQIYFTLCPGINIPNRQKEWPND